MLTQAPRSSLFPRVFNLHLEVGSINEMSKRRGVFQTALVVVRSSLPKCQRSLERTPCRWIQGRVEIVHDIDISSSATGKAVSVRNMHDRLDVG